MEKGILAALLVLGVIPLTTSNGKFYVGFLGYKNKENLKFDGECCDGARDGSGRCDVTCDLVFQVSVYGPDGSNMTNKRPSRLPINDTNSFMFADEYKQAVNPITFDFKEWPGRVQVVVQVFDQDHVKGSSNNTLEVVDEMDYIVNLAQPSVHFIYQNITGIRSKSPSEIMLLFRYECGPTYYGHDCLTDCLMYPTNPLCPRSTTFPILSTITTRHSGTSQSSEPTTPLTDCSSPSTPGTGHTDITTESTASSSPETTESSSTTTEVYTSSTESSSTTSLSTTDASSTASYNPTTEISGVHTGSTGQITDKGFTKHSEITTKSTTSLSHVSSTSSLTPETVSSHVSSTSSLTPETVSSHVSSTSSSAPETVSSYVSSTSSPTPENVPLRTSSKASTSSVRTPSASVSSIFPERTAIQSTSTSEVHHSTVDPLVESTKDPKDFALQGGPDSNWPIIVGCVLGGLVLIAIVVFFVYQNRQKRIRKRQEIYNVSPEVISVIEENGATERSDVPITTSPL